MRTATSTLACGVALSASLATLPGCAVAPAREQGQERTDDGARQRTPPFFGLDVPRGDMAESERVGGLVGCRPTVVSAFVKLDSAFDAAELADLSAGGRTPLITLEPWSWRMGHGQPESPAYALRRLVEGAWDAQLQRIARVLATHPGPVMVRFAHEMNAGWYPWGTGVNGNVPDHYVYAWRHVHQVMAAVAPDLTWVWAPVAAWWPDAPPLAAFYPGDAYVDLVGVTGYGHSGTAEDTFGAWWRETRRLTRKPVVLAEVGADGPDKSRWIASLGPFLERRPDVLGFVWFNTSAATTGATGEYRIDDEPESLSTFRSLLDRLHPACSAPSRPRRTS